MKGNVEVWDGVCPFDGLPCGYVDSCDDVLSLTTGIDMVEGESCPRAVRGFLKK